MHKFFLMLLASVWGISAQAAVYQWKDAQGHIHFSDIPHIGAKKHDIQPLHSIKNPSFNMDKQVLELPYQDVHGSMMVKARINHILMSFILDTGATLVVISPNMAKQAHINTRYSKKITLQTANGLVRVPQVMIDSVQVGHWKQQHIQAAVQTVSVQKKASRLRRDTNDFKGLCVYRKIISHPLFGFPFKAGQLLDTKKTVLCRKPSRNKGCDALFFRHVSHWNHYCPVLNGKPFILLSFLHRLVFFILANRPFLKGKPRKISVYWA